MDIDVGRFSTLRVLVIGDAMLDRYVQGAVERISPEAPVPVVRFDREWTSPGGAAHVAACLAGLGCRAVLAGVVGDDGEGATLREELHRRGVADVALVDAAGSRTISKTRVIAGRSQQLLRIDREEDASRIAASWPTLAERIADEMPKCDAVVLADYDKGTLPREAVARSIALAAAHGKPVVVDPKKDDFRIYAGASLMAPNLLETERAIGRRLATDDDVAGAAAEIRDVCGLETMLVTRGAQGMTGVDAAGAFHASARVREVADVTGAGDTVVAVLAAARALGFDARTACEWASAAAGIAVSHPGTYVVSADELRAALSGDRRKIVDRDAARAVVLQARSRGRRIAFTNGCFDILHAGHLESLREARSLADFLVVGLNSDASVRALKGPGRPIVSQDQRAALLAGLECVDLVAIFDEHTPETLIRCLEPDVLAKGADHDPASISGGDFVRSRGGVVHSLSLVTGLSTSEIIAKIQSRAPGGD